MTSTFDSIDRGLTAEQQLRAPVKHPHGWEPGFEWDGSVGTITTAPLAERPKTWDEFIRDAGLNPDEVEVAGPVNVRGWDAINNRKAVEDGAPSIVRMHYYRLNIIRKASQELPDLVQLAKLVRSKRRKAKPVREDLEHERGVVVGFADPQTGKTATRGGTEQLLERHATYRELLGNYVADSNATQGVWCDLGDAVEGFENVAAQRDTNDLDLMSQVEVASHIEFEGIDLLARLLPRVVVAGVGSNHCRWRNGKNEQGTPASDWGLHILRQMRWWTQRLTPEQYAHVSFTVPKTHDETLALDVCGQIIGLAHGHQVSQPNRIPDWWKAQSHGGQPVAHADLLLTGHFHHFRCEPVGRNPYTDRDRWWMQAPTSDNGSDWFRMIKGYDSDPHLLVFTVTPDGWDNLRLL
ncbi:MAG TPA: hypothetical protein VFH54_00705 [Mycobacteriales bacterium]|nr:hypothetical protein [Mycobacteriales bacterium]